MNLYNPINRFRIIAIVEGISFLVLLFIAMPLKRLFDFPEAVTYTGWSHGVLFILYVLALLSAWQYKKWSFLYACWAFVASLIPFATFILEKQLKKQLVSDESESL